LQNICLGDLILDQLASGIDCMTNKHEDGYVVMDDSSNNHGITMPTALIDVGHHFEEVPQRIRRYPRTRNTNEDQKCQEKCCMM
jgi:hypothetical protein